MRVRRDAVIAGALAGFSVAAWLWLIPAFAGTGEQTMMPRIAVALTGGLSLLLMISAVRRRPAAPAATPADDPFLEMDRGEPPLLLAITAIWGVVLMLPGFFGLYPGAAIATALSLLLLGMRRPLALLMWTIAPLVVLFMVFEYGFGLRLPRGMLLALLLR